MRRQRHNGDELLRKLQREAAQGDPVAIEAYWRASLKRGMLPEPQHDTPTYKVWRLRWFSIDLWTDGKNYTATYGGDETTDPGVFKYTAYQGTSKAAAYREIKEHLVWFLEMQQKENPDDNIHQLERIYNTTGATDDWTALAVARERAGLMWPEPPQEFAPGFYFQTHNEIADLFELARQTNSRVEAVFRPNREFIYGYIRDWPEENVPLGLPYWVKTRFRPSRNYRNTVWLALVNTRSRSGEVLDKDLSQTFAYVRIV